jgi:hypothetical protein
MTRDRGGARRRRGHAACGTGDAGQVHTVGEAMVMVFVDVFFFTDEGLER